MTLHRYKTVTRDGVTRWEHQIIAERMLGRPLRRGEVVHHKNHNMHDNRPENLEVLSQLEHNQIHKTQVTDAEVRQLFLAGFTVNELRRRGLHARRVWRVKDQLREEGRGWLVDRLEHEGRSRAARDWRAA